MNVPDGLPYCIRVMMHWNTTRQPKEIVHVYLREAKVLRPDRNQTGTVRPVQVSELEAVMRVFERSLQ
jgi:chorismate mutase